MNLPAARTKVLARKKVQLDGQGELAAKTITPSIPCGFARASSRADTSSNEPRYAWFRRILDDQVNHHPDHLGSNLLTSNETGVPERSFVAPFGEILKTVNAGGVILPKADRASQYLFTDQEHDGETGLQHFGARFYDPFVGRFISLAGR